MPPRISAKQASLLTVLFAAGCSEAHPSEERDSPLATDAPVTADTASSDAGSSSSDAMVALDTAPSVDAGIESDADLDAYYYPDGVRG